MSRISYVPSVFLIIDRDRDVIYCLASYFHFKDGHTLLPSTPPIHRGQLPA